MTYSIIADGLVKRFGETRALNGIDLAVQTGTVFGLLGPNGAGKTTAVRILATLARPDGGRATICGHDVVRHAHQVRQLTGLTGQYASVDETLTGAENLVLIGRLTGQSRAAARGRARVHRGVRAAGGPGVQEMLARGDDPPEPPAPPSGGTHPPSPPWERPIPQTPLSAAPVGLAVGGGA